MLRNWVLIWLDLENTSRDIKNCQGSLNQDDKELRSLEKRIQNLEDKNKELELRLKNQKDLYNLKIEQLTAHSIEVAHTEIKPISLRPPSWKMQARQLERKDREVMRERLIRAKGIAEGVKINAQIS